MQDSVLILNNSLIGDFVMFSPVLKILNQLNFKMFIFSNNKLTHQLAKFYEMDGIVFKAEFLEFTKPFQFLKLLILNNFRIKPKYIFITFSFDSIKSQIGYKLLKSNQKLIRSVNRSKLLKLLYKDFIILDLQDKHLVVQNIEYLEKYIGIKVNSEDIKLFLPPSLSKFRSQKPIKNSVIIHPGSSGEGFIKRYPLDKYIKIAFILKMMNYYVHFILGPSEREFVSVLEKHSLNYTFSDDLVKTVSIIGSFEIFLGTDSFISHLAAAFGLTTFTIFGPSNPKFSRPYSEKAFIIQHPNKLSCMPCYFPNNKTGCKLRKCLDIDEEYIVEIILKNT